MKIMESGGSKYIVGCRIHANDSDCKGKIKERESIYGAKMQMCDKAFRQFAGLWKEEEL